MPWDADRYDDAIGIAPTGRNRKVEDALERDWRKVDGHPRIVEDPCIIVDMHGRILAWNLPKVLTERRQVGAMVSHNGPISPSVTENVGAGDSTSVPCNQTRVS